MIELSANSDILVSEPRKRCEATTKAGKPCSAPPVKGKGMCAGHLGLGLARDPVALGRKGQEAQARTRREQAEVRKMSALDWASRLIQERGEEIAGAFMRAVESGDWRAAEALMTRVYGRPQERVEVSQPETVEEVETLTLAEIRLLRQAVGE